MRKLDCVIKNQRRISDKMFANKFLKHCRKNSKIGHIELFLNVQECKSIIGAPFAHLKRIVGARVPEIVHGARDAGGQQVQL